MWILALLGCSFGPCSSSELKKVAEAIQMVSEADRTMLTAQGLAESCEFAPALEKGLMEMAGGWPGTGGLAAMRAVADDPLAFEAACPGGAAVLAQAASMGPMDRATALATTCKVDWLKPDEAFAAGDGLMLAILVAPALSGERETLRRRLLRELSGIR